ncbi:MAG: hypothetical protein ABJM43_09420 [Paracoccaceae bacterium]
MAAWAKYEDGTHPQNHQGWCLVAEVLGVAVTEIVEAQPVSPEQRTVIKFQSSPGETPLHRLANLEVSAPTPLKGRNTINTDEGERQPLALSVKPIFGTLRNEEISDPDGKLLASANIEVTYAFIVVETKDDFMDILDATGFDGEVNVSGVMNCRYGGENENRNYFEISAASARGSLAGTSLTLDNFIELEGVFNRDDWIGIALEAGGLQLMEFSTGIVGETGDLDLRSQIKRQVLNRGLVIGSTHEEQHKLRLTARRYFMRRHLDDAGDLKGGERASNT